MFQVVLWSDWSVNLKYAGRTFKYIFSSVALIDFNQILQGIETKVTPQMNVDLTREFAAAEVEQALKQMKPLSAPGLDGMSPIFFKSFWDTVGLDVIEASLYALNTSSMPVNFNHTYIALIPKTKNPEKAEAKDFRLISLCNVLYKLVAKTIANQFKKLMPKLVSKSQSYVKPINFGQHTNSFWNTSSPQIQKER